MKRLFTFRSFLFFIFIWSGTHSMAQNKFIIPCPNATIGYPGTPYCSNAGYANVAISGTRGGTFSSSVGLNIDPDYGYVDLASSIPGLYTVTYTIPANGNCGTFTTSADITVTAAPSASFSYPQSPYCSGQGIVSVEFAGTTGGTFSSDPGLVIDSFTGDIDLAASTPGSHKVAYKIDASGGCEAYSTATDVTINTVPTAVISYSNSNYCTNSGIVPVNLVGDTGGTYFSSPGLALDLSTGDITSSASDPGTYQVNYSVTNNCGNYTTSTTITIDAAPDATISYDNSPYCSNAGYADVSLNGNAGGTYTSSWGLVIDQNSGQIDLAASLPGTYEVDYKVSAGNCSATSSAMITITSPPTASFAYSYSPYCGNLGGKAFVDFTGTTGGTFSSDPGLVINPVSGSIDLAASQPGTYTVTYYVTAGGGCNDLTTTANVDIVNCLVKPNPVVKGAINLNDGNNTKEGVITIYPNPVVSRNINLQFTGMAKGSYALKLINANGIEIMHSQIAFKGGSNVQSISLGKEIAIGNYYLEILHPDGTRTTQTVVIVK